jgi:hypothetical protein
MKHRTTRLLFGLLAAGVALCVLSPATPANAASNGQWSIQPTGANGVIPRDFFQYTLRPGAVLRDKVSITNLTNAPKVFAIYGADAYNTPLDAGFALLLQKDTSKDVGTWIRLGYQRLTIPASSRADLTFELDIPPGATPGDHAGGIVAEDVTPQAGLAQGKGVEIQRRVGTRIYVRVQGPLEPALRVTRLSVQSARPLFPPFSGDGRAQVTYVVTNIGNVRLQPTSLLRIKGVFGQTLRTFKPRNIPELLPHGAIQITERWRGLPIINRVTAQVTVTAPGASTVRTKSFWDIPWIPLGLLVVIAGVGLLLWRRHRGRAQPAAPPEPSTPQPPAREKVTV